MDWIKASIYTTTIAIDIVSGYLISQGITGLVIEDAEDFNNFLEDTTIHWDYIEEDLMKLSNIETNISFYVPNTVQGNEMLLYIKNNIKLIRNDFFEIDLGTLEIKLDTLNEEDWETAWKKYYHPINIGENLVVVPCWEEYANTENKTIVTLDPGMAFGTGTHETTRLCMTLLEQNIKNDMDVLDVGTGSGILSITSVLLGAKSAIGVDIDSLAVKISKENAKLNKVEDKTEFICGDLTKNVTGSYDLVCANIVADVIIRMSKDISIFIKNDGILLVSGIITDRSNDVKEALLSMGLIFIKEICDNDWVAMQFRKV